MASAASNYQSLDRLITVTGERERITVTSPLTGQTLGTIPLCNADDVEAAVSRARAAQAEWAKRPLKERIQPFIRAHDMFLDARSRLADIIQLENGKARLHAIEEPFDIAINLRFYSYNAASMIGAKRVRGAVPPFTRTWEVREPWGVVGIISPWNYPLVLSAGDAIPALIAGNAVVFKPSEMTPFTLLSAIDIFREAGVPEALMQVVTGDGATTGSPLADRADYVMFTGSTAVGRKVAEQCARRLIPYSMELGGKNPAIVLDDADLDKSVTWVVDAALSGSGQTCVSVERLYVQDKVYDAFVPKLAKELDDVRIGGSMTDLDIQIGSLTSAAQLEKVSAHVQDAVNKGAKVLAGGKPRPDLGPYFFAPTLLENVTPDMELHKIETFGPVVAVYRFRDDEEALAAANDSAYGLHASVFSQNISRAHALANRLQTGTVAVNETHKAPWASISGVQGGYKQSGTGRRHGREGMTKYTQTKNLTTQYFLSIAPGGMLPPPRWEWFFSNILRLMRRIPGLR